MLLGGVWEPIVKWRTHVFYSISTVYNLYNTPLVADILFLPFLVTKRTFSLVQASTESLVVLYVDDHEAGSRGPCPHPPGVTWSDPAIRVLWEAAGSVAATEQGLGVFHTDLPFPLAGAAAERVTATGGDAIL